MGAIGGSPERRGFRGYVAALGISGFGTQMTTMVLPFLAVQTLGAGVAVTSALFAIPYVAGALVGIAAGPWVDRTRLTAVLVSGDAIAAATLLVTLAAVERNVAAGAALIAAAAVLGGCGAVAAAALNVAVVQLAPAQDLTRANATVSTVYGLAQVGGPIVGGALLAVLSPPTLLAIDGATYAASIALVGTIRADRFRRPPAAPAEDGVRSYVRAVGEGAAVVRRDPVQSSGALAMGWHNLAATAVGGLMPVYAIRVLGLTAQQYGLTFAVAGAGAVGGAALARTLGHRHGTASVAVGGAVAASAALMLAPLARCVAPVATLIAYEFLVAVSAATWAVATAVLRQERVEAHRLGAVAATFNAVIMVAVPVGAALGVALTMVLSVPATVLAMALLGLAAPLAYARPGFRAALHRPAATDPRD